MTNAIAGTTATQEEARVPAATLEEPRNETHVILSYLITFGCPL